MTFPRMPRELLERMAAMRSDSAQEPAHRLLSLASILLIMWIIGEAFNLYRQVMAEFIRPIWYMIRPWFFGGIIALYTLSPTSAEATSCTRGTNGDCYCDCVRGSTNPACATKYGVGVPADPPVWLGGNRLICEDFEAPTLRTNVNFGGGTPDFGPPYDDTGNPGLRGWNGYWSQKYIAPLNTSPTSAWQGGNPPSPTFGTACTASSQCSVRIWHRNDLWNGQNAHLGIFEDIDFDWELPSLGRPSGKSGGGSGAFDGTASVAYRVPPGVATGFKGMYPFGTDSPAVRQHYNTIGITFALAYPTNLWTSGILGTLASGGAWKHDEWTVNAGAGEFWPIGHGGQAHQVPVFPFYSFLFDNFSNPPSSVGGIARCAPALAAATITAGVVECSDGNLLWTPTLYTGSDASRSASEKNYAQSVDFPFGTWGCVRAFGESLGTTNSRMRVWFTGPSGIERLLIDWANFDSSYMNVGRIPGFDGWGLNTFVNVNQGMPGQVPTVETTFRYQDNVHIRTGTPVSCAQIGYAASDTPVPPSPPTEVIISTITRMRGIFVTRFREIILFVSAGLIAAIHIYVKKV